MGKKTASAPEPDPKIGEAALRQAELGEDWLVFAEEQFDVANERQGELDALTKRIGESQLATQEQADRWAVEDRSRYEDRFQPVEDQFVDEATQWDSRERQERMAGEARADVLSSAAAQREQRSRELASMGVRPDSGRYRGQSRADHLATGLAAAGAENQARNQVRKEGVAMRADAANMGRGLPSQAASAASLGLGAGNSALQGAQGAEGNFRANSQIMGQGFSGAMQGQRGMASTLNTQHQNQLQAWSANQQAASQGVAGVASALGTGIGAYAALSSKELKEDKRPVDGALEAINGLPVESWKYKDGVADGGEHIGPYAEDFQRQTGKGDGQSIPIVDAIGLALKGIQELSEKVDGKNGGGRKKRRRPETIEGEYREIT